MEEVWREVKGYEGYYEVSNFGRVRSLARVITDKNGRKLKVVPKMLSIIIGKVGYPVTSLTKNGKSKTCTIHRIIAEAFIPNPENKRTVNHIDGDKTNNDLENLEWATHQENYRHAIRTGLFKPASSNLNGKVQGENNYAAKLTESDVRFIRSNTVNFGGNISRREMAHRFGVGITTIANILYRRSWKHVD